MWCQRLRQLQACLRWLSADERGGVAPIFFSPCRFCWAQSALGLMSASPTPPGKPAQHQADAGGHGGSFGTGARQDCRRSGSGRGRPTLRKMASFDDPGRHNRSGVAADLRRVRRGRRGSRGADHATRHPHLRRLRGRRARHHGHRPSGRKTGPQREACVWSLEEINNGRGAPRSRRRRVELRRLRAVDQWRRDRTEGLVLPDRHLGGDSRRCHRRLHPSDPTHQCCPTRRSAGRGFEPVASTTRCDHNNQKVQLQRDTTLSHRASIAGASRSLAGR